MKKNNKGFLFAFALGSILGGVGVLLANSNLKFLKKLKSENIEVSDKNIENIENNTSESLLKNINDIKNKAFSKIQKQKISLSFDFSEDDGSLYKNGEKLNSKIEEELNRYDSEILNFEKNIKKNKISLKKEYIKKEPNIGRIYLAGGCFWGVQAYFDKIDGVLTTVGYANGKTECTSYRRLNKTGHSETVKIIYNKDKLSLENILEYYFRIIDPLSINKQGADEGTQYRTGIYYVDYKDKKIIDDYIKKEQKKYDKKIVVEVEKLKNFIFAEQYHQKYLEKTPFGYCHIDLSLANEPIGSNTDDRNKKEQSFLSDFKKEKIDRKISDENLKKLNENLKNKVDFKEKEYKKIGKKELRKKLTDLEYKVTKENFTERAYSSELNDEYRKGIYVDIINGEPLFSSNDKFDAGCGWPSFSKPIANNKINYFEDDSHNMLRTEIRTNNSDSHLGHIFDDGPEDMGGFRYCVNGAALRFIPYEKMDEEGYSEYKKIVE